MRSSAVAPDYRRLILVVNDSSPPDCLVKMILSEVQDGQSNGWLTFQNISLRFPIQADERSSIPTKRLHRPGSFVRVSLGKYSIKYKWIIGPSLMSYTSIPVPGKL